MKKVLFSVFISSVLFFVGCQENSVTNPVSSESLSKADINQGNVFQGTIVLDQQLINPIIKGNPDFRILGKIEYTESIFSHGVPQITVNGSTTAPSVGIGLDFSINATISAISSTSIGQNEWKISSSSKDQVFVNQNGSTILVKTFPLIGRSDDLSLVCTFTVTEKGVRLDSVILNSPMNSPII